MNILTGIFGAAKFAAAVASGNIADEETVLRRREKCRNCPSRVRAVAPGAVFESDWCGPALEETPTTCGCLILGKTLVGSESCPQAKW